MNVVAFEIGVVYRLALVVVVGRCSKHVWWATEVTDVAVGSLRVIPEQVSDELPSNRVVVDALRADTVAEVLFLDPEMVPLGTFRVAMLDNRGSALNDAEADRRAELFCTLIEPGGKHFVREGDILGYVVGAEDIVGLADLVNFSGGRQTSSGELSWDSLFLVEDE